MGMTATLGSAERVFQSIPESNFLSLRRVVDIGAGLPVKKTEMDNLKSALNRLFLSQDYCQAALAFSERHKGLDINWQTQKC